MCAFFFSLMQHSNVYQIIVSTLQFISCISNFFLVARTCDFLITFCLKCFRFCHLSKCVFHLKSCWVFIKSDFWLRFQFKVLWGHLNNMELGIFYELCMAWHIRSKKKKLFDTQHTAQCSKCGKIKYLKTWKFLAKPNVAIALVTLTQPKHTDSQLKLTLKGFSSFIFPFFELKAPSLTQNPFYHHGNAEFSSSHHPFNEHMRRPNYFQSVNLK